MGQEIANLEQMLDRFDEAVHDHERISLGAMVEAVGSRAFGPLLLMAGIVLVSPLSGIPGMATSMAVLVLLIAVQLLVRKQQFWLPRWLLNRSIARSKYCRALRWMRRPARFVDRWLRPRLTFLVGGASAYVVAAFCVAVAFGMPVMELVPFSASGAGVALAAFGLSLIAHDGLLALIAFVITAATVGLVIFKLL
jgi:hypothetical protein